MGFPLGGVGSGTVVVGGEGAIRRMELGRPASDDAVAFASVRLGGTKPTTRKLEGMIPGGAPPSLSPKEWPGYESAVFQSHFPFSTIRLTDPDIPLNCTVTPFSPFVPLDDEASSMPVAILEYAFENRTKRPLTFEFSFHMSHPYPGEGGDPLVKVLPGKGVLFGSAGPGTHPTAALGLVDAPHRILMGWGAPPRKAFRRLWDEVKAGDFAEDRPTATTTPSCEAASVCVEVLLNPRERAVVPVVICWHAPQMVCHDSAELVASWHGKKWKDAAAVLHHVITRYHDLRRRTREFHDALTQTSVPDSVIDAVSGHLATLRTSVFLRRDSGALRLGLADQDPMGACHMAPQTHALGMLFPALSRQVTEGLFKTCFHEENGDFQQIPLFSDQAKVDEAAGIIDSRLLALLRLHQDWKSSGDRAWLESLYPLALRTIDYVIHHIDPEERGLPTGRRRLILGWVASAPEPYTTALYVAALTAMEELAGDIGRGDDAGRFKLLSGRAQRMMETLFQGEHYLQPSEESDPASEVLGVGILSDALAGALIAQLGGLGGAFNQRRVTRHLKTVFRRNFRRVLRAHGYLGEPSTASHQDPGLLVASWPTERPDRALGIADEVWPGGEMLLAAHLILSGLTIEGLSVVHASRVRRGDVRRNPFDIEPTLHSLRGLAAPLLLQALGGFRFDAVTRTLEVHPRIHDSDYNTFFCTATGWGVCRVQSLPKLVSLSLKVLEGYLEVHHLKICGITRHLPAPRFIRPGPWWKVSFDPKISS
ncbi:MAG: GH116 family glycosyl-hydrolase [Planctomycetota bacterium]